MEFKSRFKIALKAYMSKYKFFKLPFAQQMKKAKEYDVYKKYLAEKPNYKTKVMPSEIDKDKANSFKQFKKLKEDTFDYIEKSFTNSDTSKDTLKKIFQKLNNSITENRQHINNLSYKSFKDTKDKRYGKDSTSNMKDTINTYDIPELKKEIINKVYEKIYKPILDKRYSKIYDKKVKEAANLKKLFLDDDSNYKKAEYLLNSIKQEKANFAQKIKEALLKRYDKN